VSDEELMGASKPLPLILARELAANLATPMFLLDMRGMLVYFNDAAAILIGKSFAELGEIPAGEFGAVLELATLTGEPVRRRDSPAGIAFFEQRPAHESLLATAYDGIRRRVEATAYPLFGATGQMHGVVSVFWEIGPPEADH
jgi:PAS domain-containing protein